MAVTYQSNVSSLHPSEELVARLMDYARPATCCLGLAQQQELTLAGGFVKKFPRWNVLPTVTSPVADTATLTPNTVSVTSTSVTVQEGALSRSVSLKAAQAAGYADPQEYINYLLERDVKDLWQAVEEDLCGLAGSFTSTSGDSATDASLDQFASAIAAFDALNAHIPGRDVACVVHPHGAGQLRSDAVTSGSPTVGRLSEGMFRVNQMAPGMAFELMTVPVFQSTLIAETGDTLGWTGMLFPAAAGADDVECPLALVTKSAITVTYDWDSDNRLTKGAESYFWGAGLVNASRGVGFIHAKTT